MFSRMLGKWKYNRDIVHQDNIIRILRNFWCPIRRKDLIVGLVLSTDFTNEELEELSNLCGREAHDRGREYQ